MKHSTFVVAVGLSVSVVLPYAAEERIDAAINAKIRQEGMDHSTIMRTLHYLTDVYGPRVTGSPSLKAADEWAVKEMESWGFTNGHLEAWDWGKPGWTNDFASGAITSPVKDKLEFEVLAWTPGTNGTVKGQAFVLLPPDQPTEAELATYLDALKGGVKGRMVLVGKPRLVPVNITPPAKRRTDESVRQQYDPSQPEGQRGGRGGGRGNPGPTREGALSANDLAQRISAFLVANGAAVRINDAAREHGQIIAFQNREYDVTKSVPTVVMRNEDYGRIARILADGTPVELQFTIANTVYPEGKTAYNAIAEIAGSDKKDEVVMLGGHLDSWHSATGATDNAIGCAVMMEAARILKAIEVTPRRTIRVALWSGEEQGILGSQAYVKEHFGSYESQKPEYSKLVAYLNIDSGTGRARGAGVFGPPEAAAVVREILKPFEDFGVFGASATSSRGIGGTDHTAFNNVGLTGIGFSQDPIEYSTHTHHTNLDTYERIIEEDVRQSAITIASVLYHLAMRDDMLPRFTADQMPALPAGRGGGRGGNQERKSQIADLRSQSLEEVRFQSADSDFRRAIHRNVCTICLLKSAV
jgi:carboxypeptidase Q